MTNSYEEFTIKDYNIDQALMEPIKTEEAIYIRKPVTTLTNTLTNFQTKTVSDKQNQKFRAIQCGQMLTDSVLKLDKFLEIRAEIRNELHDEKGLKFVLFICFDFLIFLFYN